MTVLLFVLAVVAFLAGARGLAAARSVIDQIAVFILLQIGAVFLSGAGLVGAINALRKELRILSRRIEAHFTTLKENDYDY